MLSRLMRLWHLSPSVNSIFKHACAAIHWRYTSGFWSDPSSTSIFYVCEQRRLTRLSLAWAIAVRLCDKYHNLMSWLNYYWNVYRRCPMRCLYGWQWYCHFRDDRVFLCRFLRDVSLTYVALLPPLPWTLYSFVLSFDRVFIKISTPTNSRANQLKPVGLLMQRRCFTISRISCHKLEIEIGRYKKIPAESRFCPICKSDNVEDEIHFLTECPAFSVERNVFFSRISKMCKNFTSRSLYGC